MKSFKIFTAAAALLSSLLFLPPAFSQTANLNFSTNAPVSCPFSSYSYNVATGTLDVTCTTAVNNTGGGTGGGGTGPYTLTVNLSPSSSGSVTTNATGWVGCGSLGTTCNGTFAANTVVALTASPSTGFSFSSWTGGPCAGSATPTCSITMTANLTITANFQQSSTGGGGGGTTPPGVVLKPFPISGATAAASVFSGSQGVAYAFPIPTTTSGGLVGLTSEGLTGNDLAWEISISKIAGDFDVAKTLSVPGSFGRTLYPYYDGSQKGQGGMSWITYQSTSAGLPYVPNGEQWYLNLRFTNANGSVYFQYSGR